MKKTLFILLSLFFFIYEVAGQSRFGLKAGINLANQAKTISIPQVPANHLNTKTLMGYQFGAFYKKVLNDRLSLSAEPAFSVIGSSMTLVTTDGKSYNTKEKLGYIELPLTIQYSHNKTYFGIGPSVGMKIFSKLSGFENTTIDISHYKSIDAAGNVLAGYTISNKIDLNARYSHSFVNLIKDPGYAKTKNRFYSLAVLYALK